MENNFQKFKYSTWHLNSSTVFLLSGNFINENKIKENKKCFFFRKIDPLVFIHTNLNYFSLLIWFGLIFSIIFIFLEIIWSLSEFYRSNRNNKWSLHCCLFFVICLYFRQTVYSLPCPLQKWILFICLRGYVFNPIRKFSHLKVS